MGVPCRPRCAPSLPRPPEGKNLGEQLAEPLWACLRTCKPRERLNEIKFRIETYTAISKPVLYFPNTNNKVENFLNANSLNFVFFSNALFITGYANKCVCVIPRSRAAALNRAPGGLSAAEATAATSNMGTRSTFGFFFLFISNLAFSLFYLSPCGSHICAFSYSDSFFFISNLAFSLLSFSLWVSYLCFLQV